MKKKSKMKQERMKDTSNNEQEKEVGRKKQPHREKEDRSKE